MTKPKPVRRNAARTRQKLLETAIRLFSAKGFHGVSVDAIVEAAKVNKRMVYHYFGSKDDLYLAVLERAYGEIREAESRLAVEHLAPVDALKALVEFTWNYYLNNPEFLTLVNNENLQRAVHLRRSKVIEELHGPFRARLAAILARGMREGVFRRGVSADQLNLTIAAVGYYYLTNRHTNTIIYQTDLMAPPALARRLAFNVETVLRMAMK